MITTFVPIRGKFWRLLDGSNLELLPVGSCVDFVHVHSMNVLDKVYVRAFVPAKRR